jgi:hypothetical protein
LLLRVVISYLLGMIKTSEMIAVENANIYWRIIIILVLLSISVYQFAVLLSIGLLSLPVHASFLSY